MGKKKIFLISGVVLAAIILAIVLIPILFKGKIVAKVKEMANQSLLARLDFKDADVSLFRSFPRLDVRLNDLTINGINEFEGKQLMQIETLSTSMALSSLWKNDGITVSEIILTNPQFNLLVSPTGKANWDITKPSTPSPSSASKSSMKIELSKIQFINTLLTYRDEQAKMSTGFKNGNFELSGFLKGSDTKLSFKGETDSIAFEYGGKKLVSGMKVSGEGALQANFDQRSFRILDNKFNINKLPVQLQGTFVMGDKEDQYNLTFQSTGSTLDELIGFLPQTQQIKLKGYEKGGSLSFSGIIKGAYSATTFPALSADLKLTDGRLKYPSKPNEISKIQMVANLSKPQGILDSMKISISKMEAFVAGHPIIANLSVKSPVSNPFLSGDVVGEVDFASLRQTIPIDSMEIGGSAHVSIHFNGPWSAIDKGEYDNFQTKGAVTLNDFFYRSPAFPERVGIQSGTFAFNSKEVSITSMKGKFGQSDFTVDGSIANYWAYLLKDGTILGNIKLKSDLLDVTQLMNGGTQNKDTTHLGEPYVIPARIDVTVQAAVDRHALQQNGNQGNNRKAGG